MATVLAVAALGMILAGLAAHLLQQQRLDGQIDAALAQEVAEFRALAETGVDPRSGEPFTSVESERDWQVEERAAAAVELDTQRITQAWLQLISNAVKFTEPGQTIGIGSQVRDGAVQLWVRDTGPALRRSTFAGPFS